MHAETVRSPQTSAGQVRILVADDHEVMRMGIRNLLEAKSNWNICAEASDGQDAVEKALQCDPDIIIMDITMPKMNGLEAARAIAEARPDIPVILFSLHLSDEMTRSFDNPAIRGAVSKGEAARDLVDAVETVLQGGMFFAGKKGRK